MQIGDHRCAVGPEKRIGAVQPTAAALLSDRGAALVAVPVQPRAAKPLPTDGRQARTATAGAAVPEHSGRPPSGVHGGRGRVLQAVRARRAQTGAGPVPEYQLPGRVHVPAAPTRARLRRGRLGRAAAVHDRGRGPRHVAVAAR